MKNDMTVGAEWKNIVLFSLPIMIGNLLQQLYNTVDGIVVGNFVGENALAATGSCGTLSFVFLAFAIGMGNGSGIMISQLFGAKQYHQLKRAISTAIILLCGIGLALSVLGCAFSRWLLHSLMNVAEGDILDQAVIYFAIYAAGLIFQFAYNTVAAILRGMGDSKATLYFLLVAAVLNVILDLVTVCVFKWGIAGAAIATIFSQFVSAIVSIIYMFRRYPELRFKKGEFVYDKQKGIICLRLGIPTTIQQSVVSFGNVFLQRLVNSFGSVTMAAYAVGMRIENYMFIPAQGFNIGIANFTGQNTGAGHIDRIKKGWKQTMIISAATCIAVSVLCYIFASPLARLFGVTGDTLSQTNECVRFMCCFFFLFSMYLPTCGLLQGAGDVMYSTLCSMATLGTRVIFSYFFAYVLNVGYSSCWKSVPLGWVLAVAMSWAGYFSGRWKNKGIITESDGGAKE